VLDGSQYTVQQLADALAKPVFTLYLGRKSCPVSLPLQPQVVTAATLCDALESVQPVEELSGIIQKGDAMIYWRITRQAGLIVNK
jgi:CRISPR system Cascade subunit CasD